MVDPMQELRDQKLALDQSAIVAQTDSRGLITMVNDKFCEISGYSREELVGQSHQIVNSGFHPKSFFQTMWRTIQSGQVWRGEICNRKKSGDLYWVATTITPLLDTTGRPHSFLAIRQDITELKNAKQIILDQQVALVNASRLSAIGEMAAAITHEINNPLAVILGRAEMIQMMTAKGTLDPSQLQRSVETILVTGKRIEKIVRSMKSLSRQGDDEEPMGRFYVSEIVSDALELCAQRFRDHGIALKAPQIPEGLMLTCHNYQIVQILVNLLNNAFDAAKATPERWVSLEIGARETEVDFMVTDSGRGVAPEVQSKLFEPFFSTKRVQYGTGLGLSISKSIAEKHKGRLFYDSDSRNTRFVLQLPRA